MRGCRRSDFCACFGRSLYQLQGTAAIALALPLRVRYAAYFATLVSVALLGSGLLQLSLAYRQNQAALSQVQREQAAAAAGKIQRFALDIGRDLTRGSARILPPGQEGIEERRNAYIRLMRETSSIVGISYLDATGRELVRVSQLVVSATSPGQDRSQDPAFTQTRRGKPYFGPLYLHDGAEPYATVSVPEGGPEGGVVVAEVKLATVWDEVSRIKVGHAGLAYVVDAEGVLVAHPLVSLVLSQADFSSLTHVREALASGGGGVGSGQAVVGRNLEGRDVLATYELVDPPGWVLIIEQPLEEAFAPLNSLFLGTAVLLVLGVLLSLGASWLLARRMVAPIQRLQVVAAQIGAGSLTERIDVKTGDELEQLAGSFNAMADQLEKQIGQLRESRARVVKVQEGVRREIASHLHGRVQGRLLALRGRLQQVSADQDLPGHAAESLREVVDDMGHVIQQEISTLSRRLYPAILSRGLVPALQSLADSLESALPLSLEVDDLLAQRERADRNMLPEPVRLAAYRVAEEALTNVLKHTSSRRVLLRVDMPPSGGLRVIVRDDGRGFDPRLISQGLGMSAMADYAGALGGQLSVTSAPEEGAEINLWLPVVQQRG